MKKLIKQIFFFLIDCENYIFFKKRFSKFRGVYRTFNEALNSINNYSLKGYNNDTLIEYYKKKIINESNDIKEYEYPLLFWIEKIIKELKKENIKVFDLGGNLGLHYFKSFHYNTKSLEWKVCELEKFVELGQKEFTKDTLTFTRELAEANNKDIFFSSGSIQYIENFSLPSFLSKLQEKPKYILLARLPMQENSNSFVTLQNGGSTFYPQFVFNKKNFICEMKTVGYQMLDMWQSTFD
jgi:putative methyltransferase (TIGR04325 family)